MGDGWGARNREANARQAKEGSESVRDIGDVPKVLRPRRKGACRRNFRRFCETYFPSTFALRWSDDHLKVIGQIEVTVLSGGLFATAMPRGSGKTSLAECACIFASVYGHRDFTALVGADRDGALQMLASIKTELESNDLLFEDFPEVCHPIRSLEGISHRCKGQTCKGERTHIRWGADIVVLPTIEGSQASGTIIRVASVTGKIRGMKGKKPDGTAIRPKLVIVDDPQTDESAYSASQCQTRERILAGAILGLAGPGSKISGIMPCTVIKPGDLADRMLDRDLHPEWHGTRTKMVYKFPANEALWVEYAKIRAESLRAGKGGAEATEFYRKNRKAMDEGSEVAWPQRHNHDEISAIQHAMNLKILDERAFYAEYQNEPLPEKEARSDDLRPDQIAAKTNGIPRRIVPLSASRLVSFIDVQKDLLFYAVVAWEENFSGYVIDYGAFPDQGEDYYLLRTARKTLAKEVVASSLEGQIYGGLEKLCDLILGRSWERDDGAEMRVERCLIDRNWGESTPIVDQFCRRSKHANILIPARGIGIGAAGRPMGEYRNDPGDRFGLNWRMPKVYGRGEVRRVDVDVNYWKSFLYSRFATSMGDPGCLSLYGDKPGAHRLLSDHMLSEFRIRTSGRGREVDEWRQKPERMDNHFFDCLVGCCVGASIQGVSMGETRVPDRKKRKRVSFAEWQGRRDHRPKA